MINSFKPYYYYSINDPKREPIDKIIAISEENALSHFAERKNIDENTFKTLYKVDIYVPIEPK